MFHYSSPPRMHSDPFVLSFAASLQARHKIMLHTGVLSSILTPKRKFFPPKGGLKRAGIEIAAEAKWHCDNGGVGMKMVTRQKCKRRLCGDDPVGGGDIWMDMFVVARGQYQWSRWCGSGDGCTSSGQIETAVTELIKWK